jgi:hypothetical protein
MPAFEVTAHLSTPHKVVVIARNEDEALIIGKAELENGGGIASDAYWRNESFNAEPLEGDN